MQVDSLATTKESNHPDDPFAVFLNTIIDGTRDSKDSGISWNVAITIANTQILLKVDIEVTVISESVQLNLKNTFQLGMSKQKLYGTDHLRRCYWNGKSVSIIQGKHVYSTSVCICNLRNNLLGLQQY